MKKKIIEFIKENKKWIIFAICIIVFVDIIEDILDYEIVNFDTAVFNAISFIKNNNLTNLFKFITAFGSAEVLVLIFITFVKSLLLV